MGQRLLALTAHESEKIRYMWLSGRDDVPNGSSRRWSTRFATKRIQVEILSAARMCKEVYDDEDSQNGEVEDSRGGEC